MMKDQKRLRTYQPIATLCGYYLDLELNLKKQIYETIKKKRKAGCKAQQKV